MFPGKINVDSMLAAIQSEEKSERWFDYIDDPYYPNRRALSREMALA